MIVLDIVLTAGQLENQNEELEKHLFDREVYMKTTLDVISNMQNQINQVIRSCCSPVRFKSSRLPMLRSLIRGILSLQITFNIFIV